MRHITFVMLVILGMLFTNGASANQSAPFMAGERLYCDQGNFGSFSHQERTTKYGFDFSWYSNRSNDEGFPILACMSGRVYKMENSIPGYKDNSWGNYVLQDIGAGNGFRAAHLLYHSIFVLEGELVEQGQVIGLLGNTGDSFGAHVHVQRERLSDGLSLTSTFDDIGIPNAGSAPTSANDGVFDRAESMFSWEKGKLGSRKGNPHLYYSLNPNDPRNVYVQEYQQTSFNGRFVYDAFQGARWAMPIRQGFDNLWRSLGGPRCEYGKPLGAEYDMGNGMNRQDFQYGYFTWTSSQGVRAHAFTGHFGPGVYRTSSGGTSWNVQKSYLFAQAHYRNGAAKMVGSPDPGYPGVHSWDHKYDVQDFRGGTYGDCMLVYDPDAQNYPTSVQHYTDWYWSGRSGEWNTNQQQAYLVRGAIRTYWINHRDALGAPITDEYPYGSSGQRCQRFIKRNGSGWLVSYAVWYGGSTVRVPTVVGMNSTDVPIDIVDETPEIPALPRLLLTPNPTSGPSSIHFSLPEEARVQVQLFDIAGRLVQTLLDETRPNGDHNVSWDGKDGQGNVVASGIYFVRLATSSLQTTKRLVVLR